MVEAFSGKWQVDLSSTTGIDEYGAAMGFSPEKTAMYKGLSYWIEFSTSGDTHTAKAQCDLPGAPQQIYTFKIGETIDFISFDGDTAKLTVTIDGGKIVEKYQQEGTNKEWTTTREVKGNTMISNTTAYGACIMQKFTKV